MATPFVPGGAGAAIKAARTADKATDALRAAGKIDDAADAAKAVKEVPNTIQKNARFVGDVDGKLIDTYATPKGTYIQPNGMRTDVLQNKAHIVKLGNGKIENVGTSHTHETYKNILPSGEIKEGVKRNEAHDPTY